MSNTCKDFITVELDIPSLGDEQAANHVALAQFVQNMYALPSHLAKPIDLLFQHYICAKIAIEFVQYQKTILFPTIHPRTSIRNRLPYITAKEFNQLANDLQHVFDHFQITGKHQEFLLHHYQLFMMWKLQMCYANHVVKKHTLD